MWREEQPRVSFLSERENLSRTRTRTRTRKIHFPIPLASKVPLPKTCLLRQTTLLKWTVVLIWERKQEFQGELEEPPLPCPSKKSKHQCFPAPFLVKPEILVWAPSFRGLKNLFLTHILGES